MKKNRTLQDGIDTYIADLSEMLNLGLMCEYGIPIHPQDFVLWVESIKVTFLSKEQK
ncbi:MAG: hypothetical protein ACI4D4_00985 [Lachnospira sp.]